MNKYYKRYGILKAAITWVVTGMTAFVWWFLLYPELCFPEDTYEIEYDAGESKEALSDEEIYDMLMLSDEGHIVIKSRILEWLKKK